MLGTTFVLLAGLARNVADDNEQRLLQEQADQAGAALMVSVQQVRTPLEGVARAVALVGADQSTFNRLTAPLLGEGSVYSHVAVFDLDSRVPIATSDGALAIEDDSAALEQLMVDARTSPFVVVDLLDHNRTLGYAVVDDSEAPSYLVYAERTLSPDPTVRRRFDEPFSTIDYALYFGDTEAQTSLLGASVAALPIEGRRATTTVAFGNSEILLVTTPRVRLGGELLASLWWIVLASGLVVSAAAGFFLHRLNRLRAAAVALAHQIHLRYRHEHAVAETLQLALLPDHLDPPPDCELGVSYWPADLTSLVGGDFYDVFATGDGRWIAVVGDVCGHGIDAAALTGLARHTIRGAAPHVHSPAEMLATVHRALHASSHETFCTVCLISIRPDAAGGASLTMSLGGHPQPLLRRSNGAVEAIGRAGTLLGLVEPTVHDIEVRVEPGDVLLLYTDGLTDAPHDNALSVECLHALLEASGDLDPISLIDAVREAQRKQQTEESGDDTILLAVRFAPPIIETPGDDLADAAFITGAR